MGALVYDCRHEIERAVRNLRENGASDREIIAMLLSVATDIDVSLTYGRGLKSWKLEDDL